MINHLIYKKKSVSLYSTRFIHLKKKIINPHKKILSKLKLKNSIHKELPQETTKCLTFHNIRSLATKRSHLETSFHYESEPNKHYSF